jgi:hypothetical protein
MHSMRLRVCISNPICNRPYFEQLTSAWSSDYAELACDVDNGTSLLGVLFKRLLLEHVPQLSTAAEPRASVVDGIQAVEEVHGHVDCFDNVAAEDTGTVDGVVEPLEVRGHFVHVGIYEFLAGNVACFVEDGGRGVDAEDGILCELERVWVDVGNGDSGAAGACETLGDSGADAYRSMQCE